MGAGSGQAADATSLACPNGQTIFLEGTAPPGEALLIALNDRIVGGGFSDRNGVYRLPLRLRERPGVYAVEVRLRTSRTVVGRFTCFVDVPLDASLLTPSPEPVATRPAPTAAPTVTTVGSPTATATLPIVRSPNTPTPLPTATSVIIAPTPTFTTATATVPGTPSPGHGITASPTPNTTASPRTTPTVGSTPGATATVPTATEDVKITRIVLRDPAAPNQPLEFVEIRNNANRPIDMTGWRLYNASRPEMVQPYLFTGFTIDPRQTISVFSEIGQDDPESGNFFWNRTNIWRTGDRAELRDAAGRLISVYIIGQN